MALLFLHFPVLWIGHSVAWAYVGLAGLPIAGEQCTTVQPTWWPQWLPPYPGPFSE
jgi:hypothetical protein